MIKRKQTDKHGKQPEKSGIVFRRTIRLMDECS